MNILKAEKISDVEVSITATFNGKYMGRLIMDVDGYFYYQADTGNPNGYWSQEVLKELATLLEIINKPHNDRVIADLEKYKNENTPLYAPTAKYNLRCQFRKLMLNI